MNLHTCIFTSYWALLISLNCPVGCAYPDASIPTEKKSESALALLLLFIRFCSSPSLHQSLWNMRNSKRQQVRHSAVCFTVTLISNVVGRKRARVLAVLRWSEGEKAWPSQEFLQDQLDPGVWRSDSCSRPALCPTPWSKLYCRRWCEHVKHLEGRS